MKNFAAILGILLCGCGVFGAEIVYPKSDNIVIDSETTFFIGNENPDKELKINGEKVNVHQSGGFYQVVKLNKGENIFEIDNGQDVKTYKITRPEITNSQKTVGKYIAYESPFVFVTKSDNVPLRSTPFDGGINRLQHLGKGIPFIAVGEYGDFYKVQLARDDYGYISKEYALKDECFDNSPAKILLYTYEEDSDKRIFTLKLNKKVPYILSEKRDYKLNDEGYHPYTNGLDLTVYNVEGFAENKYEFHINSTGNSFGYKSYFKNCGELVIEVKNFPNNSKYSPLKGLKITLDPGHGGTEYGAIGCLGDKEKDINLAIALKLKPLLEKAGAKVIMTRIDDSELSLNDRVKISQDNDSDVFISIHNNALPDSLAGSKRSGTGVYYFYPQSYPLSKTLLDTITKELSMNNDKVRQESFAVLRNSESLSVLLEIGYMIVPEDNAKLVNSEFQQNCAKAILHGLEKYFNVQH